MILWRLLRRTVGRIRDGAELWPGTGNRETVRNAFFSRDSLFVWALRTYRVRKASYARLFGEPELAHVTRLRFARPADAERWLDAQRKRVATHG